MMMALKRAQIIAKITAQKIINEYKCIIYKCGQIQIGGLRI